MVTQDQADQINQAIAATEEAARPFTLTVGLKPGREAMITVPLDLADDELLFLAGKLVLDGRMALFAQRQRDKSKGLVVAQAMPQRRPS